MGIRHLQTFQQRDVRNGYYKIDIVQEILSFKRFYPKPILVIDVMSFITVASRNTLEGIFGGRFQIYEAMYHSVFQQLQAAGAELVFFIDGPVQEAKDQVWLDRQNEKYLKCIELFDKLSGGDTAANIIRNSRNVPNIHMFQTELQAICKMYGRTFVSFYNECDLEVAAFAGINNALAVIADDTDYLIHRGHWRYWSARELDILNLTTFEYDRQALRHCLRLSDDHMYMLATIGGNDVLKYDLVEGFHKQLPNGRQHKFIKIAHYIRNNYLDPNIAPRDIEMLCEHIFGQVTNELYDLICQSLRSYNVDLVKFNYESDDLLRYAMNRGKSQLYCLLANKVVNFTLLFDDLRLPNSRSNFEIALPLLRRQMGIVLQHKRDPQLVRYVCTKLSHDEPYSTIRLTPEYPSLEIPPLLDFYLSADQSNDPFVELRISLLVWFLGSASVDRKLLNELPSPHLIGLLTINYLREQNVITIEEADLLLLMTHDIITRKVPYDLPYPEYFNERLVKVTFIYLKTMRRIKRGFHFVKLKHLATKLYFDGVYLHTLASMDNSEVNRRLQEVNWLRIYANR